MKKSKMTLDSFFKQLDVLMPEEMREDIKDIFTQCKDASRFNTTICVSLNFNN